MPVGFKNRTDGNVQVAVDAVRAASVPHAFAGIDPKGTPAILYTRGNADCHVILRGGKGEPNFDAAHVSGALELLGAAGLPQRVMIDLSHDNSGKDPERQPHVAAEVGRQIASGNRAIVGVMLESFLVAGRQDLGSGAPLTYGQSITDGCLDWETTVHVLDGLAARKLRAGTELGRMLDPIADKILVAVALMMLVASGVVSGLALIPALVILAREILVSGLREFLATAAVSVPVTRVAKMKTVLQMIAIGAMILGPIVDKILPGALYFAHVLLWVAAALTVYTGFVYLRAGLAHVRTDPAPPRRAREVA